MSEIAFNLLDEPWIRLMGEDCAVRECTLPQALLESHRYRRLAGELPTQNVAILRLLLAVLHTVFYRVDLDGEEDPIEEPTQALQRWQRLWKAGCFPEAPIRNYLNEWKERFWLFHPEHPFFQVPSAAAGTQYTAAKLNGELSESSNKVRLFPVRAGQDKDGLSYAEAARWLVNLNGFDDTSAKPKGKGLPSPGAGWQPHMYYLHNQVTPCPDCCPQISDKRIPHCEKPLSHPWFCRCSPRDKEPASALHYK